MLLTIIIWSCILLICTGQQSPAPVSICIAIPPEGENYAEILKEQAHHRSKRHYFEPQAKDENEDHIIVLKQSLTHDETSLVHPFSKTSQFSLSNETTAPDNTTLARSRRAARGGRSPLFASLQLFVVSLTSSTLFKAGESRIGAQLLSEGNHILKYQIADCSQQAQRLGLAVAWDGRPQPVHLSEPYRDCARFRPTHVTFYGPPSLARAAMVPCVDDTSAQPSSSAPPPSSLGLAALCSVAVMTAGAALAFVLSRRYYVRIRAEQQHV